MALSADEELAFAELAAQFHAGDPPPRRTLPHPPYLALSLTCVLGGAALLAVARHEGMQIAVSNHFGFAISSIVLAISLAGFTAMLVAAFLLGRRQTVGHRDEEPDERDRLYLPDEGSAFLRPGYKP